MTGPHSQEEKRGWIVDRPTEGGGYRQVAPFLSVWALGLVWRLVLWVSRGGGDVTVLLLVWLLLLLLLLLAFAVAGVPIYPQRRFGMGSG